MLTVVCKESFVDADISSEKNPGTVFLVLLVDFAEVKNSIVSTNDKVWPGSYGLEVRNR